MNAFRLATLVFTLAASLAPLVPSSADAFEDDEQPRQFTCPVGGESFEQDTIVTTFPLEMYPDGGAPGVEASDDGLAECPSNGLVLMPEYEHEEGDSSESYSEAEIALLPALIGMPEYQALRSGSRAARLLWLAEQLERPAAQRYHLLQRAAWVRVRRKSARAG